MALIETYRELDHATRAAKDMAANIKVARQQAKIATELWQNTETQKVELEQQLSAMTLTPTIALPPFFRTSNTD